MQRRYSRDSAVVRIDSGGWLILGCLGSEILPGVNLDVIDCDSCTQ